MHMHMPTPAPDNPPLLLSMLLAMIETADARMDAAKRAGRNRVVS